jgi:hypothetical protein
MSGIKDDHGIVHIPSDGYEDGLGKNASDPWFALCEVWEERFGTQTPTFSRRESEVVDERPNCIACLAVLRDALRDQAAAEYPETQ